LYQLILTLHSWLRWVALFLAILVTLRALAGWSGRRPWLPRDERLSLFLTIALDVQLLLGLALYLFLSPLTAAAFDDFGAAMRVPPLRYWAVEHSTLMVVAIVLVHVGRVVARRASDTSRHARMAIFAGLATLAMLAATPWPGMANARPLLRLP
jgi:hypothetical protein